MTIFVYLTIDCDTGQFLRCFKKSTIFSTNGNATFILLENHLVCLSNVKHNYLVDFGMDYGEGSYGGFCSLVETKTWEQEGEGIKS